MPGSVRASQVVAGTLGLATAAPARASQIVAQILYRAPVPVRASQVALQMLYRQPVPVRAAQIVLQLLMWELPMTTPPVFPALPGLGFSVVKRPVFYTAAEKSGTGWQVGISYASTPTWEWDLTYEVLADLLPSPTAASDLKRLLGFMLAMGGDFGRFLFQDPDDHSVAAQPLGTTDGTTTAFTLVRTFGAGAIGTEPVGYVNTDAAFNLYLDGALQSPTGYSVVTATPGAQQVVFTSPPLAGHTVSADFGYYFYVHFKDSADFEKFANQLWDVKKITLESLRG